MLHIYLHILSLKVLSEKLNNLHNLVSENEKALHPENSVLEYIALRYLHSDIKRRIKSYSSNKLKELEKTINREVVKMYYRIKKKYSYLLAIIEEEIKRMNLEVSVGPMVVYFFMMMPKRIFKYPIRRYLSYLGLRKDSGKNFNRKGMQILLKIYYGFKLKNVRKINWPAIRRLAVALYIAYNKLYKGKGRGSGDVNLSLTPSTPRTPSNFYIPPRGINIIS